METVKQAFDLSKFKQAVHNLDLCLREHHLVSDPFLHTYDLSLETIRLFLEKSLGNPTEIEFFGFEQLIRRAYAVAIISEELFVWKKFRDCRNNMTFGKKISEDNVDIVRKFLFETRYIVKQLEERIEYID